MAAESHRPLLILGMHRSGTSYLASLVSHLGVFIGDDLVGAQAGNPRGHFEETRILEFHQALIEKRIGREERAFDDGMLAQKELAGNFDEKELAEANALTEHFRSKAGGSRWGWKEPRTCLFLSLWEEILGKMDGLIVYRHPVDVHQSLMRRGHWDLSLFPDQAYRSYALYNNQLLSNRKVFQQLYIFNANRGFAEIETLICDLQNSFHLAKKAEMPAFHAGEFGGIPVSRALHALFKLIQPEAAAAFEEMEKLSSMTYPFVEREDDDFILEQTDKVEHLLKGAPRLVRSAFVPWFDWISQGRDVSVLERYVEFGEEIGGRVQRVEEWNREAAMIHSENSRLSDEITRMGKIYKEQQAFLAEQTAMNKKIWGELTRTGKSWEEQRTMIINLHKEKEELVNRVQELENNLNK